MFYSQQENKLLSGDDRAVFEVVFHKEPRSGYWVLGTGYWVLGLKVIGLITHLE